MMGVIVVALVGLLCVILGLLLWKKEMISLLHDYHYDKVSPENKRAFCKLSGIGLLIVGCGLLLTALLLMLTDSAWSFLAFVIGFSLGLGLIIRAGNRYNKA